MTRNQTNILGMALVMTIASEAIALEVVKPTLVDTFNKWTTWSYNGSYGGKGEGKVCYIYSKPEKMQPTEFDHGPVSFSITSSPADGIATEANFVTGYPMKEQSPVTVQIAKRSFTMFSQADSAWLVNKEDEAALLAAMKDGSSMVVRAVSQRGSETTYHYSLSGVTAAANKMIAECK